MESLVADIYNFKGLWRAKGVNTGRLAKLSFIWSKAFYCFSLQTNSSADFNLKSGEQAFIFLAEFAINLKKLTFPIRLYSSFLFLGGLASCTTFDLFLSRSILWLCTKKLKKLPAETPKAHLAEFIFKECFHILMKNCSKSAKLLEVNQLDNNIINIYFHIFADQIIDYKIHCSLIGYPYIL